MENKLSLLCIDSLEKVFPDETPHVRCEPLTALRGETVSFQVAYKFEGSGFQRATVKMESALPHRIRRVSLVPSGFPCYAKYDENYLRTTPGMYPDLLEDLAGKELPLPRNQWHSIWLDIEVPMDAVPGEYSISVSFTCEENSECNSEIKNCIKVMDASLPKLPIQRTEWFYADCLADYYHVDAYSEEHWRIIESFFKIYVKRKANMILTPVFTPPLDTYVGGVRTDVQLVKITVCAGQYSFDFSRLERFVRLAQDCGIEYFEISHLFTQWGVRAAPNIFAEADGTYKLIFGWDNPATGGTYEEFLRLFLPELTAELTRLGIAERSYFHISDEPNEDILENYKKAKEVVAPYLKGFHMMDALSEYSFYAEGLVEIPACANDHIEKFLENHVENLWSYYCCGQSLEVSNRFMAMPSYRNRIYGIQLYLYGIRGMLHWGFNFYNSVVSKTKINPYRVTDCDYGMPSGDSFLVYPGEGGVPEESIRIMVLDEAMSDLCALYLLESLIGRDKVAAIIDEEAGMRITFKKYPQNAEFILKLRNRVNMEIEKHA